MSVFKDDEKAWSVWTKSIEGAAGDPGEPLIVQSPTVIRALGIRPNVNRKLAWFRRLVVGDSVPPYGNKNILSYVGASGHSVGESYRQYVQQLNAEVIKRFVNPAEQAQIDRARRAYEAAQRALTTFVRDANKHWKKSRQENPNLTRAEWDRDYGGMGFTPQKNLLVRDSQAAYGRYQQLSNPYPQVARVAQSLARLEYGSSSQIALPQSEDDIELGEEAWDPFFKTNIDPGLNWDDFFSGNSPQNLEINQASSASSFYDHRWSVGGSVSYGFFSIGGGASGGHVEQHLRQSSQSVRFTFERLVQATVVRGAWFDGGLVNSLPYHGYVSFDDYWGPKGTLSLIPVSVLVGRGVTVEIATNQTAYDAFQSWYHTHGGASFSFGPWRVGGGGSSSTSWGSTTNTSSGSTIRIADTSGQACIVAVISQKMDDLVASARPFIEPAIDLHRMFEREEAAAAQKCRALVLE